MTPHIDFSPAAEGNKITVHLSREEYERLGAHGSHGLQFVEGEDIKTNKADVTDITIRVNA